MSDHSPAKNASSGFRRLFRILGRPVRRTSRQGRYVIQTYRGYGHRDRVLLMGRVLRQPAIGSRELKGGVFSDVLDIASRFVRHGIGNAAVKARAGGEQHRVETDREGYFTVSMRVPDGDGWRGLWRPVDLELLEPESSGVHAEAPVYFPPRTCRFVVISDIDDTVMYTGVANKLKMLWRLFATDADSRLAFPGVGAFYRSLHEGVSGSEFNPMLYVSRGPWGIYEVLEEFFNLHEIPVGPVLFLREWGVTLQHPLPKQSKGHKHALIEDMLAIYDDLPFILIGDSGQRDPEIYAEVVREHRSRVLAVYIRNVSRDPDRARAIETLAEQIAEAGSSLVLAADSHAMALHAAEHGFISPDAPQAVREEQVQAGEVPHARRPREVGGETPSATREAVKKGRLKEALDDTPDQEPPKSIVVE